jgi:tight adherence protein C
MLSLALGGVGYCYADIYLSGIRTRRTRQIFRDLPDLLDILRLAVSAGLDLTSALRVCVENVAQGPLLKEFEVVERDIALGATRTAALERMAARVGMNEFNSFVMAVKQADELGSSIGPILQIQSEMAREKRLQVAEELLAKLPTKLLGPLVICIFPASFIVLFTPLILDFLKSGF